MGAGIVLPSLISIAASVSEALIFGQPNNIDDGNTINGPWTPPQYGRPALTVLTVPGSIAPNTGQPISSEIAYVFDAVFRILHRRTVRKTSHPVLTGANISDHAYNVPSTVTLEIGMSDAMASYQSGVWVGASTKSISAWQILKNLAQQKTLFNLATRLDTYYNMLIIDISSPDDNKTGHALRATVVLEELLAASIISTPPLSAVPQTSGSTQNGVVQPNAPNSSQVQQYQIPSSQYQNVQTYPQVPGAGSISSNNLGSLPIVVTGTSTGVP